MVLDSYLTTLEGELDNLEGDYVENLRKFVNDRLRDVISGYHALTAVAGALVAGEQDMWERTDTEYIDLLKSGISNFSAYAERASDSDDGSKTLSVVGAIIGAAGVFATGPVAPVALGLLGTTVSLVDTFMPEPPEPEEVNVYGSSYEDINNKFWESEEKLASSIRTTENAFHDAGANARDKTTSDPRAFDMRRQKQFL